MDPYYTQQDSIGFPWLRWFCWISAKEMVAVCGSGDALGQWTVAKALPLDAGESLQIYSDFPGTKVRLFAVKHFANLKKWHGFESLYKEGCFLDHQNKQ